jgi:Mrp family chromosome partitioning ATPase
MSRYFDLMQQAGVGEAALTGRRTLSAEPSAAPVEIESQTGEVVLAGSEILDLVQRIFLVPAENGPRVVVFAGVDGEGDASQVSSSVAETLASVSKRPVCLVEANFRSPKLPNAFGTNRRGLVDALAGEQPIANYCRPMGRENLWLLPCGAVDSDSPSLITPDTLKSRFTELRDAFEFIIVNGAPIGRYAETLILGRMADGVALVMESGSTRREEAATTIANIRALNIPILAGVLNKTKSSIFKKLFR